MGASEDAATPGASGDAATRCFRGQPRYQSSALEAALEAHGSQPVLGGPFAWSDRLGGSLGGIG